MWRYWRILSKRVFSFRKIIFLKDQFYELFWQQCLWWTGRKSDWRQMIVHPKGGIKKIMYTFKFTNNLGCLNFNLKHSWRKDGLDANSSTQRALGQPEMITLATCHPRTHCPVLLKTFVNNVKKVNKGMLVKIMDVVRCKKGYIMC